MAVRSKSIYIILEKCREPTRFSELEKALTISKVSLYENLKRLMRKNLIQKTGSCFYVLTERGKVFLSKILLHEKLDEIIDGYGVDFASKLLNGEATPESVARQEFDGFVENLARLYDLYEKKAVEEKEKEWQIINEMLEQAGLREKWEEYKKKMKL